MRGMSLPQASNFVIVSLSIQIFCTLSINSFRKTQKKEVMLFKHRGTQYYLDLYCFVGGKYFIGLKYLST